jgi:hypothetical protein
MLCVSLLRENFEKKYLNMSLYLYAISRQFSFYKAQTIQKYQKGKFLKYFIITSIFLYASNVWAEN